MRPRAVLPQDSLPTEVAGMKISVPRFSPRRLFSSFPLPPVAHTSFGSPTPSGVPAGTSLRSLPPSRPLSPVVVSRNSWFKRHPHGFSPGKRLPRFTRSYNRVLAYGAQLLATVTGGISTRGGSRLSPVPAVTSRLQPSTARRGQMRKYSAVTGD